MEEEPKAKTRRLNNNNIEKAEEEKAKEAADCISGLPDHLLHEILACLPTEVAVRTSLLSRRWRTVWTTSPDLSLTHLPASSVDSALRLRDPAVPLRSFSLATSDDVVSDPARARSWIDYAANYSALQRLKLELVLMTARLPAFRSFRLPPAVFRLQHLRVLELWLPGVAPHLDWPATAFFPFLQRLDLVDLNLSLVVPGDAISNSCPALKRWRMLLFRGPPELDVSCPLLEVFELRTHVGPAERISIRGNSIREVRVRQELPCPAPAYLKISAPELRILEWLGQPPRSIVISGPLPSSGFTYLPCRDAAVQTT